MRYPSYSELIFINGLLLNDHALMTGKKKTRDIDLLLAAEQRPQASAFGADAYPSLKEKAAVLLHAIARNHPFADGNKRTATVAALFLLAINGETAQWQAEEALTLIVALAEGQKTVSDFVAWLVTVPSPPYPEAQVERDTTLIKTLIHDHQSLLDELAKR